MSEIPPFSSTEPTPRDDLVISEETLVGLTNIKKSEIVVGLEDGTNLEIQTEKLGDHKLITVTALKDVDGAEYIGELIGTIYVDTEKLEDVVVDLPNTETLGEVLDKLSKKHQ